MFLHVRLGRFVGVMPSVKRVSPCGVWIMGRFFVLSGLMMFSCLAVVTRGMRMMLAGFAVTTVEISESALPLAKTAKAA